VFRFGYSNAAMHVAQCRSDAPRAMIRLKSHSIMAFELSPCGRGINCQRRQLLVRQPTTRRTLYFSAQTLNQFRWTFARFGRMTPQTRTIPALNRFYRGSKKIDILSRRLFGRAGGPTENSRRAHSDKKYAFEARVAIHERAIHRFSRRKKFRCFHV